MSSITYPASPIEIPEKLTGPSGSYMIRAILAIVAIILFFALYAALLVAFGYLFYLAVIFQIPHASLYTILAKLGAIAGAGMLVFFTIKFLFKLKNRKPENRIKLSPQEHPQLWSFVEKVCQETGAPLPKSIYVDPDVNAYVAYSNHWLSLFLPVRKELTIGLGLVNSLNLSQFKGVIAHEFGHFSQRSMKIGSYIASANTIIHDMIFTRDSWDDMLAKWRSTDIRLSIAAWAITPVIWIVRQILKLFYSFLNIMHSSLSREMEFNADKVAVSVAGSDAIVSALWKMDNSVEEWHGTLNNAYLASQKQLYSRNLYQQQSFALQRSQDKRGAAFESLPEDHRGGKRYFTESKNSKVHMYASHPPNDLREANAKAPFVPCPVDERSPWILFSNPENLQQEMSLKIYQTYFEKKPESFAEVEEFERFVEREAEGKDVGPVYSDTFRDRFLYTPTPEELENSPIRKMRIEEGLEYLKEEIARLMKPVEELNEQFRTVQGMADGTLKQKTFKVGNATYKKKSLQWAWKALAKKRDELFTKHFLEWDTAFCALHLDLAETAGVRTELERNYAQHTAITRIYQWILRGLNGLAAQVETLQEQSEVTSNQITAFGKLVKEVLEELNTKIAELESIDFVPLPNINTVKELQEAIIDNGKFVIESGPIFEEGRYGRAMHQLERARFHCQRIEQKSFASILKFQAELEKEFLDRSTSDIVREEDKSQESTADNQVAE
ncbi:MAG: M48 family metallopeptidase [Candidatus Kapaibacterium sp.]